MLALISFFYIFTAMLARICRRRVTVCLCVCVCLSVCLSHASIISKVSKRLKLRSRNQRHTITKTPARSAIWWILRKAASRSPDRR